MAKVRIGWVGFIDGKPYWQGTLDDYVCPGKDGILTTDIYKSNREAKRRFEDVREVFVEEGNDERK